MPTVFIRTAIEDEPGTLSEAATCLAKGNVNIDGLCVAGGQAFFLTSNAAAAEKCLEEAGYKYNTTEAFEVRVPNKPGELARVSQTLAKEGVNIDCCFGSGSGQGGTLFVAVDNASKARPIIERLSSPKATATLRA